MCRSTSANLMQVTQEARAAPEIVVGRLLSRLDTAKRLQLTLTLRRTFELDGTYAKLCCGNQVCFQVINEHCVHPVQPVRLQEVGVNGRFWFAQLQATRNNGSCE